MGRPWSLALPLLYCCCWGLGAPESPAGSRTSPPSPWVQTNGSEILAVTPGVGPSSEEGSQTRNLTKTTSAGRASPSTPTSVRTPTPASTTPEAEAGEAENASPSPQSKVLTKIGPSRVTGASTPSTETPAAPSSLSGTALRSDSLEPAVHILCTEDSSEEVQVAQAPASAEAQGGSISSETTVPARAQLASTIVHEVLTHCDIIEIEAADPQKNLPSGPSTPGATEVWSAPETSALPESPEAKSQPPRTHTSPEDSSTATTTPSPTVAGLSPSKSTRVAEGGTAVQAPTLGGTWGTLSTSSLEETTRSEDSPSPTELTGASVGFPPGDRAAVTKATSPAGSSVTSVYSPQGADASTSSSSPGNSSLDSVRWDGSPVPSGPPTAACSSAGPTAPLTKSTDSASSGGTDAAGGGQPPTPAPTSAPRKWTPGISSGEGAGFLLLRLSVVSWEDLLDSRVAERLMQQLRCELHAHMPLTQVTLLRVTRS